MKYDIVIIGGGIVGLASALNLVTFHPHLKIALLEKEDELSAHQTGHNSGVIHSGIYYKPGSLKAVNCRIGYEMLLTFCNANNIKYDLCGKLIVATEEHELTQLEMIYKRGLENGLANIKMVEKDDLHKYEPNIRGLRAVHVPYTGIINYTDVSLKFAEIITQKGVDIFTSQKVNDINVNDDEVEIITDNKIFHAKLFLNCAGLFSDKVAAMSGEKSDTRIIPFRGEYFMLKPEKKNLVKNLIYPVPDPNFPFLGVHFTRTIEGGIEAGPNAVFAFQREGYNKSDVNLNDMIESFTWPGFRKVAVKYWKTGIGEFYRSFSKTAFTNALRKFIPQIEEDDLIPAEAGVRAQACDRTGGLLDDFKIIEKPRAIHILNAPSPAATSSLAIGKTISEIVFKHLG